MVRPSFCRSIGWLLLLLSMLSLTVAEGARAANRRMGIRSGDSIFRVDGEMHTLPVRALAVDNDQRFAASVGGDETIRFWSLPKGELRRTYRIPTDHAGSGKLYAVAVSGDGTMVAAAGSTAAVSNGFHHIYLLDVATGRMLKRFGDLRFPVTHLAFSSDDRYLAAVLAGTGGLRVFASHSGTLVAQDKNYRHRGNWVSFSADGRLVTTSADGMIRLYDHQFHLSQNKKLSDRYRPHAAAFSPDGQKIAIGLSNRGSVLVLSADTLELLYLPDARGVRKNLRLVAWSRNGHRLFAGGGHRHNNQRRLIR